MGFFQARVLECIAISLSRGSSRPRNRTRVSCIASRRFTAEPPGKPLKHSENWHLNIRVCMNVRSVVSDSLRPLWTVARQAPGKNTGVGCHFLLQGTFLTQGSNPHLLCILHCRQILYPLSHWASPYLLGHNFCGLGVKAQFGGVLCFKEPYKRQLRF